MKSDRGSVERQKINCEMTADFKAKKLTEFVPETERVPKPKTEYKVYNERQVPKKSLIEIGRQNYQQSTMMMMTDVVLTLFISDGGYWDQLFCSTLQITLTGLPSQRWQKR